MGAFRRSVLYAMAGFAITAAGLTAQAFAISGDLSGDREQVQASGQETQASARQHLVPAVASADPVFVAPPAPVYAAASLHPAVVAATGLSADYMTGRWTVTGDCNTALELKADGTMLMPEAEARWALRGEQLVVFGRGFDTEQVAAVKVMDANTILVVGPHGRVDQHTRCA